MKFKRLSLFLLLSISVVLFSVLSCQTLLGRRHLASARPSPLKLDFLKQNDKLVSSQRAAFSSPEKPQLCTALRGNGDKVLAHLASMAAIVEKVGIIDGTAGSSSSAISLFLYESALINPHLWNCGGKRCDEWTARKRLAFSLKMGDIVVKKFLNSPLIKPVLGGDSPGLQKEAKQGEDFLKYGFHPKTKGLFRRLKQRIIHRFAWKIMSKKYSQFLSEREADLVNPVLVGEAGKYLINLPAQKRWEIMRAFQALDFNNSDISVLFREGVINFPKLFDRVGMVANFLSGRGRYPAAEMRKVFESACIEKSFGKSWSEFSSQPVGKSCEKSLGYILEKYFSYYRKSSAPKDSRLQDPIGGALKSIVPISVIVNEGASKVERASREYKLLYETRIPDPAPGQFEKAFKAWTDKTAQIPLSLDFEKEILYGYWGRYSDLRKIAGGWQPTDEVKSQKFTPLGTPTWREVLLASPVEPGLSRIQPLPKSSDHLAAGVTGYMAGGWVDLHPTQVSRLIGCEKVVFITREWPEDNEYAEGLVKIFRISPEKRKAIYDIENPNSSFNRSLKIADAIWCTHWGKFSIPEFSQMTHDSFHSPIYLKDPQDRVFTSVKPQLQNYLPGCMPIEKR